MKILREMHLPPAGQSAPPGPAAGSGLALAATDTQLLQLDISQARSGDAGSVQAWRVTSLAGGGLLGCDAVANAPGLAHVRALIAAAGAQSVKLLTIEPAAVDTGGALRYADALNRTYFAARALIPDLERHGVHLALRIATRGFLLSPPESRDLLDRIGSAHVGADVGGVAAREDRAATEDWLDTLGGRVFVVGVHTAADAAQARALAGQGILHNAVRVDRSATEPGP